MRPFLKWLGGKYRIVKDISAILPESKILVEPFVGAGAVFLNTNYDSYILNDVNNDLISLYRILQEDSLDFIKQAKKLFTKRYNTEKQYYKIRDRFNNSDDIVERSMLFLYMNRHGYNGMCRYNKQNLFNVPYGRYVQPYYPQKELEFFSEQIKKATLCSVDFSRVFSKLPNNCVVYCDPPYVPLSNTANFTNYSKNGFNRAQQELLVNLAEQASFRGISTLISNNYNDLTKQLYNKAEINLIKVSRTVSCNINMRQAVMEVLALYKGKP